MARPKVWLSATEFAKATGRSQRIVREACADGRLGKAARKNKANRWELHRTKAEAAWQASTDVSQQRSNPGKLGGSDGAAAALDPDDLEQLEQAQAEAAAGDELALRRRIAGARGDYRGQSALRVELENWLAVLKLEREQGALVPAAEVGRTYFNVARQTRDKVLQVVASMAAQLGPQVAAELERELVEALEELSSELTGGDAAA